MKEITIAFRQSLMDIALQHYGDASAIVQLAADNNLSITDDLNTGQKILIDETKIIKPEIVKFYKDKGIALATDIPRPNKSQTITFPPIPQLQIDDNYYLSAVASSGLFVRYVSSDSSVVSIENNLITVLSEGEAVITAYQDGNDIYFPATPVSQVISIETPYDLDAQAFFDAVATLAGEELSEIIKDAVNTVIVGFKDVGIWELAEKICFYVGGNAIAHSINAKNPSEYQSTFGGSPTHNVLGIHYSGVGQWTNHNFPRNILPVDDFAYFIYSGSAGVTGYEMGIEDVGTGKTFYLGARVSADRFQVVHGNTYYSETAEVSGIGLFGVSTVPAGANTIINKYKGATSVNNQTVATSSIAASTYSIYEGALNSNGGANYYSNRNIQFSIISRGMSGAQVATLNSLIAAFQATVR